MFADRRITSEISDESVEEETEVKKDRDKLVRFKHVVCSYHGLANDNDEVQLDKAIPRVVGSKSANVDVIAEEVTKFLQGEKLPSRSSEEYFESGVHVAGFNSSGQPQIYHIFYNKKVKEVTKELHNEQYHDMNGKFIERLERQDYFALFNGANCIVKLMQDKESLEYKNLTFDEVIEKIEKQIYVTFTTKRYSGRCGDGLNYVTIPKSTGLVGDMKKIMSSDDIENMSRNEDSIQKPTGIPISKDDFEKYQERKEFRGVPPSGTSTNIN